VGGAFRLAHSQTKETVMPSIDRILDRQVGKWESEKSARAHEPGSRDRPGVPIQPILTVSRQRGSDGTILAERIAERFGYTLLHRDVIDRICESSGYKRRIIESLDGRARSQVQLLVESVLQGAYVDASDYLKALLEVIYSISQLGGVVVVGRGSNFILGHERGFHIRVVAPLDVRVRNLAEREGLAERDALREIEKSDRERTEWIRKACGRSIDDPLGYDLVINHVSISMESATRLVAAAAQEKFERMIAARTPALQATR
jgi:cytidylate kinase